MSDDLIRRLRRAGVAVSLTTEAAAALADNPAQFIGGVE